MEASYIGTYIYKHILLLLLSVLLYCCCCCSSCCCSSSCAGWQTLLVVRSPACSFFFFGVPWFSLFFVWHRVLCSQPSSISRTWYTRYYAAVRRIIYLACIYPLTVLLSHLRPRVALTTSSLVTGVHRAKVSVSPPQRLPPCLYIYTYFCGTFFGCLLQLQCLP